MATPAAACPTCGEPADRDDGDSACPRCSTRTSTATSAPDTPPPKCPDLPGFRFTREIGSGGQGRVWQAIRLRDNRKVAVKTLRPDRLAEPRAQARFEQEYETLKLIEHAGIVRVLEHGRSGDGGFWFASEYVVGLPLDRHVDRLDENWRRTARPGTSTTFPLSEVLELFMRVCQAVHAAHQAGVIHRDLKPSNILVDDEGRPHIVDFGLARTPEARHPELVTLTGEYLGSPAWSSPEQIAGQPAHIDVRTDVYSLGVILYRLLTGEFPYDVNGPLGLVFDQIRDADPTPPRALATFIDDEVQAILLKALAKDRSQRYQSVAEFQADLDRYLHHEPVSARGQSTAYAIRKFIRRHRVTTAAVITFVLLSALYGTAMTVLYHQASVAEQRAARNAVHAQQAVEFILTDLDEKLKDVLGTNELRQELLETAYNTLSELRADRVYAPELDADYASTLTKLSSIALELRRFEDSLRDRRTALAVHQRIAAANPDDPMARERVSIAHVLIGDVFKAQTNLENALAEYTVALDIDEQLVREYPDNDRFLDNLSWSYERLGYLAGLQSDHGLARAYYEQRHELAVGLVERHPDSDGRQFGLACSLGLLAETYRHLGSFDEALPLSDRAFGIYEDLVDRHPANRRYLQHLAATCDVLACNLSVIPGRRAECLPLRRRSVTIRRHLANAEPESALHRYGLGRSLLVLGRGLQKENPVKAKAWFDEGVAILEALLAVQPEYHDVRAVLLGAYTWSSVREFRAGRQDAARRAAEKALTLGQPLATSDDVGSGPLMRYAEALLHVLPEELRDAEAAAAIAERAVRIDQRRHEHDLSVLAEAQHRCGRTAEAIRSLEQALEFPIRDDSRKAWQQRLADLKQELTAPTETPLANAQ